MNLSQVSSDEVALGLLKYVNKATMLERKIYITISQYIVNDIINLETIKTGIKLMPMQ